MRRKKSPWKRFLRKIFLVTSLVTALLLVVIGIYPVHGNSNFPMLKDGDLAITQKIGGYQIGDLVAFRKEGKRRFARIVAAAGDEITISGSRLLVNGMVPAEEVFYPTRDSGKTVTYPCRIGQDMVFVLNDYREDEKDSRTYGPLATGDLDGKVIFLFRRRKF